jgi:hypothetical protein
VDRALALEKLGQQVPADEAGGAGDEVVQGSPSAVKWRDTTPAPCASSRLGRLRSEGY